MNPQSGPLDLLPRRFFGFLGRPSDIALDGLPVDNRGPLTIGDRPRFYLDWPNNHWEEGTTPLA